MTKHIPQKDFIEALRLPDDEENDEHEVSSDETRKEVDEFNAAIFQKRLYEGIAVLDEGSEPHLLCDDQRSLMQHLYKTRLLIVRKYKMAN